MGNQPKVYTKEQLNEMAQDVFDFNPDALGLFATSDGNFFLPKNEGAYKYHLSKNPDLKGHVIERPHVLVGELDEEEEDVTLKVFNAKLDAANESLKQEPAGEPEAKTEAPAETPKTTADAPAGEASTGSGTEGV